MASGQGSGASEMKLFIGTMIQLGLFAVMAKTIGTDPAYFGLIIGLSVFYVGQIISAIKD